MGLCTEQMPWFKLGSYAPLLGLHLQIGDVEYWVLRVAGEWSGRRNTLGELCLGALVHNYL